MQKYINGYACETLVIVPDYRIASGRNSQRLPDAKMVAQKIVFVVFLSAIFSFFPSRTAYKLWYILY